MKRKGYLYSILFFTFLLGVHDGYVALWVHEDPLPQRIYPYSVQSLPLEDQLALSQGIPIADEETLNRYLEDLLS